MTRLMLAPQAEHVGAAPPITVGLSSAEAQRRLIEFGPTNWMHERTERIPCTTRSSVTMLADQSSEAAMTKSA
jgi:hypothetical protein